MPIMQWDKSLDVGVASMNRGHKDILDLMNQIYDAREQGRSGPAVTALVGKLSEVCVRHFADEEAYMASIAYPALASHKILHAQLLERFGEHARVIAAEHGAVRDEFFRFLKFWLTSHIKGVDVKYAAHSGALQA
jgi:hemerythrin-like metal-binding protein